MTRTLRTRTAGIELETGGNPLSNPYATFPEDEKTEEEIKAEAVARANKLICDFMNKSLDGKTQMECLDALCVDSVVAQLINVLKVSRSTDCTKLSGKYFDALQGFVQAFEAAIVEEMIFDITHE